MKTSETVIDAGKAKLGIRQLRDSVNTVKGTCYWITHMDPQLISTMSSKRKKKESTGKMSEYTETNAISKLCKKNELRDNSIVKKKDSMNQEKE